MVKLTDKEKTSTKIGAVVALLFLFGALALISTVDSSLSGITDEAGELVPLAMPAGGTEKASDLNVAHMVQVGGAGCGPATNTVFSGLFNATSITGNGTAYNTTGPAVLCDPIAGLRFYWAMYESTITAQDVLDSGAQAVSFGMVNGNASRNNESITAIVGLISPGSSGGFGQPFCGALCGAFSYTTGTEGIFVIDSDFIALMASFPNHLLTVSYGATSASPYLPDFTDEAKFDLTLYGEESQIGIVPAGGGGTIIADLSGVFSVEVILATSYYLFAVVMTIAAALMWPTMTLEKLQKKAKGGKS